MTWAAPTRAKWGGRVRRSAFVVVPVFNEQKTIAKFVAQLDAIVQWRPA
jgi:hypothetical protein